MSKEKFAEFTQQTLENNIGGINMKYVEVSIEEAMKRCKKNAKVLVAVQDLSE